MVKLLAAENRSELARDCRPARGEFYRGDVKFGTECKSVGRETEERQKNRFEVYAIRTEVHGATPFVNRRRCECGSPIEVRFKFYSHTGRARVRASGANFIERGSTGGSNAGLGFIMDEPCGSEGNPAEAERAEIVNPRAMICVRAWVKACQGIAEGRQVSGACGSR